jgi:hypothetical protein
MRQLAVSRKASASAQRLPLTCGSASHDTTERRARASGPRCRQVQRRVRQLATNLQPVVSSCLSHGKSG